MVLYVEVEIYEIEFSMMLVRYAENKEVHGRARSMLCNILLNGNTHINRTEI
jgi:hypothetical protein